MTRTPWNKNKSVGQKKGFTPRQLEMIREFLINQNKIMELALLNIGVDTMLRYSDVSKLKVEDVLDWKGNVKDEINLKQKKTNHSHLVSLSENSKWALKRWIKDSKKFEDDYLFSGNTKTGNQRREKLSRTTYTKYIKEWAQYLHLNPQDYASHSLRRTRAAFMYKQGVGLEIIRRLLGQKSIESTKAYLGIEQQEAFEVNKQFLI